MNELVGEYSRPPSLPANFCISNAAADNIRAWIGTLSDEKGRLMLPAIFMGEISQENGTLLLPVVGAYFFDDVDTNEIFTLNCIDFVYPVLEKEHQLFEGKTLDLVNNKYVLK